MTTPLQTRKILFQQGIDGALVQHPAEDVRLASGGLWTPDPSDPLRVRSGVVAGAPSGVIPCNVTAGVGQLTVGPGRFVIQGSTALQGHYEGVVDQEVVRRIADFGGLPAAGQFKAGVISLRVYDQLYGDAEDGWRVEIRLGAAATTVGAAAYPAATPSTLNLRNFTVDSAGTISLNSAKTTQTVARGGVLPIAVGDLSNGAYLGQYRDHETIGLGRWDGVAWQHQDLVPVCRLRRNAQTGSLASGAFTSITWDTEDIDNYNMWTSGSDLTIRRAGVYLLHGSVGFSGSFPSGRAALRFDKPGYSGTNLIAGGGLSYIGGNMSEPSAQATALHRFEAGEKVRLTVYQDSGSARVCISNDFSPTSIHLAYLSS